MPRVLLQVVMEASIHRITKTVQVINEEAIPATEMRVMPVTPQLTGKGYHALSIGSAQASNGLAQTLAEQN
jgi:hypothetical protein